MFYSINFPSSALNGNMQIIIRFGLFLLKQSEGKMNERKIRIDLGPVQETLMVPLWARAKETEKNSPIIYDTFAKEIFSKIDYDFSKIEAGQTPSHQIVWPIRAYNFDINIQQFLQENRQALVVNIGAGLDTSFQRLDDGRVLWINVDLPDVVALRQKLIPDSQREITIAQSIFDFSWTERISQLKGLRSVLFMAAGVLCYFEPAQVKTVFLKISEAYPSAHLLFDAMSRLTVWGANRDILKKSGMDSTALLKWHLKRASSLKKWVNTLKIIDEYSMFAKVPYNPEWGKKMIRDIKIASWLRLYNMVHVQF